MGYETKMYVVNKWDFCDPPAGEEIACIDLCKCGDGAVSSLISSKRKRKIKGEKPPFVLYARNPDRQMEAVDILREAAKTDIGFKCWQGTSEDLEKLSNHIEDGTISEDKYGDFLVVLELDEMIAALKEDYEKTQYRRFKWALNLLESMKDSQNNFNFKIITYGH